MAERAVVAANSVRVRDMDLAARPVPVAGCLCHLCLLMVVAVARSNLLARERIVPMMIVVVFCLHSRDRNALAEIAS